MSGRVGRPARFPRKSTIRDLIHVEQILCTCYFINYNSVFKGTRFERVKAMKTDVTD